MTITELAQIYREELKITYNVYLKVWQAYFTDGEIKEGPCLVAVWGCGSNMYLAMSEYIEIIKGKTIVFNASSSMCERREFGVPQSLECGVDL